MIFTDYKINYLNLLKITISFLLVGILAKSISKTPSVLLEIALLGSLLFFSLIYSAQKFKIKKIPTIILIFFLLYLFIHTLTATLIRPFIIDLPFYDILLYNLLEFRLSTISYFLPLIFIPLSSMSITKFENFLIIILKFSIIYTILEQILSLGGFRQFFEYFYSNAGIVSSNQIGVKSLGMYRVWGVVGFPQLLGVFHAFGIFYMLYKHEKLWTFLSLVALIFSTSKTAYLILMLMSLLYLLYKRQYAILLLTLVLLSILSLISFNFYFYLQDNLSDNFPHFQKFMGSIVGFFILIFYVAEESAPLRFIEGGPLFQLLTYFSKNPLEIIFGKGLTYSYISSGIAETELSKYQYLTSDFYILTFFEQYGLFGTILITYIFLIYPLFALLKNESVLYFVPIIFFLSMFHYPPHIPKLMMVFASYPIYKLYFYENK